MSTVVLADAPAGHSSLTALLAELHAELARGGEAVRTFDLATTKLAYCLGEFDCWVRTPGRCRTQDAEAQIVRAIHDADALVLLDPVTFGGHGHRLKRAQDRLICLLTPFFEKRSALTHHPPRHARQASFYALGWLPRPDLQQAATWRALADANAVNLLAPRVGAAVVDDAHRDDWPAAIRSMFASTSEPGSLLDDRGPLRAALIEAARPSVDGCGFEPPRRAALLVGSPKPKGTSASETIARALARRLSSDGVLPELHFSTELVHEDAAARASARAIAGADLFVLVTPLYFDAFPSLVTHALELVAQERSPTAPSRFVTIVNCGFPEPEHIRTALRIARCFCQAAGYSYAGGLPLGGGGVVTPETSLDDAHGPVAHVARALDLAAPALARGDAVPEEALAEMMRSPMPDALYRLAGDLGFRRLAHRLGVPQRELRACPFDDAG